LNKPAVFVLILGQDLGHFLSAFITENVTLATDFVFYEEMFLLSASHKN